MLSCMLGGLFLTSLREEKIKRLTSMSRNQKVVILVKLEILSGTTHRQIELLGRFGGKLLSLPKRWLKIKACLEIGLCFLAVVLKNNRI